jgi:hypothetical protein
MHVTELDITPAALVGLEAAGIKDVDEFGFRPATDLAFHPYIGAMELYDIVCQLIARSVLPRRLSVPLTRLDREMFWLHLVDGLTLDEISQKTRISAEGVHYFLSEHFGLNCTPPAVTARHRQQESRE